MLPADPEPIAPKEPKMRFVDFRTVRSTWAAGGSATSALGRHGDHTGVRKNSRAAWGQSTAANHDEHVWDAALLAVNQYLADSSAVQPGA